MRDLARRRASNERPSAIGGSWGEIAVHIALLIFLIILPVAAVHSLKNSLGDHYLLLVSYLKTSTMNPNRLETFDHSAYDGVAVTLTGTNPYDAGPPSSVEEISARIVEGKRSTNKDLWPWVYFTRMVGRDPGFNTSYGRDPYFFRIHGADLENAAGAQDDFVKIWGNSLRAARENHTPGIVVDLEFYMNYKAYDPSILAQQMGKDPKTAIELLKKVGARLADAAEKEYPGAVLWFLFTDLGQAATFQANGTSYYPSPAYLVMGLLDQIRAQSYSVKVISGGEVGLAYCSLSVSDLHRKIVQRARDFAPHLQKYGPSLELGGTMILWSDKQSKTDFITEGACGKSEAATVEDLEPYLELLLKSYRYNWIYGVYSAGYDPFHPRSAPRFDAVISRAKKSTGFEKSY